MKYEKPEVTVLAEALDAVQCQKKYATGYDCSTNNPRATPAYEADE